MESQHAFDFKVHQKIQARCQPYREELVVGIDRGRIPEGVDPKVDKRLRPEKRDGGITEVLVTGVTGSKVTLDSNYPLARNDLVFGIQLLEILWVRQFRSSHRNG